MAQDLKVAPGRQSVVPMAAPDQVQAAPFFSNLTTDPCTTCNYDSAAGGYFVWGVNNCTTPGTSQWIAVPFVSGKTGIPKTLSAAIVQDTGCVGTGTKVTLSVYTDACGLGPAVLVPGLTGTGTVAATTCLLTKVTIRTGGTSLTLGTKYWLVATTDASATQNGLNAVWYASNGSQIGGNVAAGGWFQFSGFVPAGSVN